MLPSLLAREVISGLQSYLTVGWEPSNEYFRGKISEYVSKEGNLYKGSYLSISLPFKVGSGGTSFFNSFKTDFPPYLHQEKAWRRLKSENATSTIIATGTGSGKTECFLYPLLDHCLKSNDKGIKAIIIYPMNALATDQAGRIAEMVWKKSEL